MVSALGAQDREGCRARDGAYLGAVQRRVAVAGAGIDWARLLQDERLKEEWSTELSRACGQAWREKIPS